MNFFEQKGLNLKVVSRAALSVLCLLLVLSCTGSGSNESGGFRGLKWGEPAGALPGLKLLAEDGDLKFYEKSNEQLKFEDVDVESIVYGFYKDRFYNVMIYYRTAPDLEKIKAALSRQYGDAVQPDQAIKTYFWNMNNVNLLLNYDETSESGRLSYFFKPIQTEVEVSK